jgi:Peptidase family S41
VFRDRPLAVLIDKQTRGEAERLAAALQDAGRAIMVGIPTYADNFVSTSVPIPDSDEVLVLATGHWERPTPLPRESDTPIAHVGVMFETMVGEPGSPSRSWRVVPEIATLTNDGVNEALGVVIRKGHSQPQELHPPDALQIAVDQLREELRTGEKTSK